MAQMTAGQRVSCCARGNNCGNCMTSLCSGSEEREQPPAPAMLKFPKSLCQGTITFPAAVRPGGLLIGAIMNNKLGVN